MFVRKPFSAAVLMGALSLLASACSDAPMSPRGSAMSPNALQAPKPDAAVLAWDGTVVDFVSRFGMLPQKSVAISQVGDTTFEQFTIDPNVGAFVSFGANDKVAIPAHTVCDPSTSGYGAGEWMKPCNLATRSITFTVRSWIASDGRPYAYFTPDVRFSPTAPMPSIYFYDASLVDFSKVIIPWCNRFGTCVDEGATDASEVTYALQSGTGYWVYRNLRHFSGYNVVAF
ncbi:MAG: hypothetical protein U0163_11570 [Gemmatimonadaceae bacterium]